MLGESVVRLSDAIFLPVTRALAGRKVGPAAAHALELASALASGACLALGWKWAGVGLLAAHGFFDYLDGGLRRAADDPDRDGLSAIRRHVLVDKASDMSLCMLLACGGLVPWWLAIAAGLSSVIVSAVGMRGHRTNAVRRETSLFDRSDRVLILLAACACLGSSRESWQG